MPSGVASGGYQAINQSPPFERTVNSSQSRAIEYPNIVISIATGHGGITAIRRTIKRQTDIFEEAALAEAMPHPPGLRAPGPCHPGSCRSDPPGQNTGAYS